ncbi:gamma-glutamyl-gamma-aminobutyrate hydrolase family protein [Agrilactobacillus fermenti]|uniref:gamma-glutamyl-gamma-aminobutyrate hydrolase family protein n=1 Tax=Agrilactobacillus fermenti TaxID=2586909 RepID=UPI001E5273A5|nr:gamma-glutamyl-gamma-aminobutyrate hydrolase family protein [Agrilactobacillus fermenti]MCD2257415.1 gamma-glutamyl-gamma-aminobutyrate hydrolase family protein [Agrilactobacillus fermenti]
MKPKIAIIANQYEFAEKVFHNHPASYVPQFYIDVINQVGGLPYLLPLTNPDDVADYVPSFDGFLLTGGQGVSPFLYGEAPLPKMGMTSLKRDTFEINLIQAVQLTNKPLLGICRGFQVLNVALGGTLYQDLSYREAPTLKHMQIPTDDTQPSHYVLQDKPSFLKHVFGDKVLVNSLHSQGIKQLAANLEAISVSTDGVIEGFQSLDAQHQFFGVEWHPEMLLGYDQRNQEIFRQLIIQATKAASA